jgi:hypothetical protein
MDWIKGLIGGIMSLMVKRRGGNTRRRGYLSLIKLSNLNSFRF